MTHPADQTFLDANVLFSAAWAPHARMRRLWTLGPSTTKLLTSDLAIAEARRNLPPARHPELHVLLRAVRRVRTPPRRRWLPLPGISLPDADMAILQAAIAAGASHLLTGNRRDFGPYYGRKIGGVTILLPADYPAMDASAPVETGT